MMSYLLRHMNKLFRHKRVIIMRRNRYLKWHGTIYRKCEVLLGLTLSVPENLINLIFEMPIITQSLNINSLRTTSAKSINLDTITKLVEYSLKNIRQRRCLLLPFSRFYCPKVGRNCDPPSEAQGAKGIKFQ